MFISFQSSPGESIIVDMLLPVPSRVSGLLLSSTQPLLEIQVHGPVSPFSHQSNLPYPLYPVASSPEGCISVMLRIVRIVEVGL